MAAVQEQSSKIQGFVVTESDYVKMQEIAKAVYENPSLLSKFEQDPEKAAFEINGFVPPKGAHIHIADAQNKLYPSEEEGKFGAEDRPAWARTEIRVGYKTFSLVGCV